jgi:hypothetical protein
MNGSTASADQGFPWPVDIPAIPGTGGYDCGFIDLFSIFGDDIGLTVALGCVTGFSLAAGET